MHVAIIGGDQRMLYTAQTFMNSGDTADVVGFERAALPEGARCVPLFEAVRQADFAILPVRPVVDGALNAPFAADRITMDTLAEVIGEMAVFSGFADSIREHMKGRLIDYSVREEFLIRNAVLTAECAIGLLINEYSGSLQGAASLVVGYGRIGRLISRYLCSLGAKVTVSARRAASRAWAQSEGHDTCDEHLRHLGSYDILINTVPAPVLTACHIDAIRRDALILDLASSPGGVDKGRAEERGVRCIHALALPGRMAPAAAGRIIKDTICNILKEENGGKDNGGLCDDRLLLHL